MTVLLKVIYIIKGSGIPAFNPFYTFYLPVL